ncbi:hypothetical protein F5Y12DRAFT_331171 [Xylaria sp. FL1777]|nr:hypothetical protein F5Y12DRAFT_331171 [Xylaria sp. FL1777]
MLNHNQPTRSGTQDPNRNTYLIKTPELTREFTTQENPVTIIHPAAMSGIAESAKSVTSPQGKAASQSGLTEKAPQTPQHQTVPRSIPDVSESQLEDSSGDNEGEMVPAAGRINDDGEVIDDDGNPIGKVTDGEASKFAGYIVTQEGDILDENGGVVGKAKPLEDVASDLNYTMRSGKDTATGAHQHVGSDGNEAVGVQDVTSAVGGAAQGATDAAGDAFDGATGAAEDVAQDVTGTVGDTAQDVPGDVEDAAKDVTGGAEDASQGATGIIKDKAEDVAQDTKGVAEDAPLEGLGSKVEGLAEQHPIDIPSLSPSVRNKVIALFDGPFTIADGGKVKDHSGKVLGKLAAGSDIQDLVGKDVKCIDEQGNLLGENDTVLGKVDIAPEGSMVEQVKEKVPEAADRLNALEEAQKELPIQIPSFAPSVAGKVIAMFQSPFNIAENGQVTDQNGKILGKLAEGQDYKSLIGKEIKGIDEHGNLLGDNDTELGKVDLVPEGTIVDRIKEEIPEAAERLDAIEAAKLQAEQAELPDLAILEGLKINKMGNVVDQNGNPLGKVKSGDLKKLVGKMPDKNGKVWDDRGNVIGEVEVLPEAIQSEMHPFEDFPDAAVDKFGKVIYDGRQVGVVVGDDWQKLIGKKVDADGDILDKNGNVIGHAERQEEEEPEEPEEEQIDYSVLRDKKVNKLGNVVDEKGKVWGQVVQGILKHLVGKKVGDNGQIFNDAGQVIGKAEPVPDSEREEAEEPAPFEDFPDAVVGDNGDVLFNGEKIGIVVEGDAKKLKGKSVDADGDIIDRAGNVLGHAERWEPEAEEPEPEIDMSSLAGKRINKAGNAVDSHGDIYGRVIEGSLNRLIGKMCDKNGFIRNEGGDVIGKCELIPEAEREGMKEGPFAELSGCTVTKAGTVVTAGGDVVGKLVSGDPAVLAGRPVDDDGDILDRNGNVLGHAERWEEPEVQKDVSPMSGRKVNREGNVVDESGDIIGKLTSGTLSECAGKKIDDDADVVDQKGNVLGHCSLLSEIPEEPEPEPEPTETEEERAERLQREQDSKIAGQIAYCIEQSLDKIKPICRMIVDRINQEEAKSEEDRDEEELIKQVRPLIEEGGKILTEANGVIRGLDPDGRISAQAKHHTAGREATPEEYHLAELLKELTGTVTETIENAKRKLENLPKAKKGINPLWGLLSEPLFQIIAAVASCSAASWGSSASCSTGSGWAAWSTICSAASGSPRSWTVLGSAPSWLPSRAARRNRGCKREELVISLRGFLTYWGCNSTLGWMSFCMNSLFVFSVVGFENLR